MFMIVEQKKEIDWKRNFAFATFGCFYLGGVQYAIYVPLFGRIFPNAAKFAGLREFLMREGRYNINIMC